MFEDIYEVTHNDYRGFVRQLNSSRVSKVPIKNADDITIGEEFHSNKNDILLCAAVQEDEEQPVKYYIINMPDNDERIAAKPVRHVILREKEEAKLFLDFISSQLKRDDNNDKTI